MSPLPSPIDGAPMRKVARYGVELDICNRTGGVWLDKGELEKIVQLVREEAGGRYRAIDPDDDRSDSVFENEDRGHRRRGDRRSRLLDILDL